MSQIIFRSETAEGQPVDVMTGWDRPLQHFFLTIFDPYADEDESEVLYSSIDDPEAERGGGYRNLQSVLKQLGDHGVDYPDVLAALLYSHKNENAGNIVSRFITTEAGRWGNLHTQNMELSL